MYSNDYYNDSSSVISTALRAESAAKRSFSIIALAAAVYAFASQIIVMLVSLIFMLTGFSGTEFFVNNYYAISIITSSICMYLLALPLFYLIVRNVPVFPIEQRHMSIKELLCIFLVSRAALFAGSTVSNWITSLFSAILGRDLIDDTTLMVENTPIWLLILIVVIIGPFVEELIYRKWMIDRLGAYGDVTAILFTSVLFGLGHGNFFQFAYAFLLGLVLGYVYTRTGNIWYSTGLHMLTNFLGSIAVLPLVKISNRLLEVLEKFGEDTAGLEELLYSEEGAQVLADFMIMLGYNALSMAVALAGTIIFFLFIRRLTLKPRLLSVVGRSNMTRVAILNIGMLCFSLVTIGEFILSLFP